MSAAEASERSREKARRDEAGTLIGADTLLKGVKTDAGDDGAGGLGGGAGMMGAGGGMMPFGPLLGAAGFGMFPPMAVADPFMVATTAAALGASAGFFPTSDGLSMLGPLPPAAAPPPLAGGALPEGGFLNDPWNNSNHGPSPGAPFQFLPAQPAGSQQEIVGLSHQQQFEGVLGNAGW